MFAVHVNKGLTGRFRIRGKGKDWQTQCEVLFGVNVGGIEVETYTTWRAAAESDMLDAYLQAMNDNESEAQSVI